MSLALVLTRIEAIGELAATTKQAMDIGETFPRCQALSLAGLSARPRVHSRMLSNAGALNHIPAECSPRDRKLNVCPFTTAIFLLTCIGAFRMACAIERRAYCFGVQMVALPPMPRRYQRCLWTPNIFPGSSSLDCANGNHGEATARPEICCRALNRACWRPIIPTWYAG